MLCMVYRLFDQNLSKVDKKYHKLIKENGIIVKVAAQVKLNNEKRESGSLTAPCGVSSFASSVLQFKKALHAFLEVIQAAEDGSLWVHCIKN